MQNGLTGLVLLGMLSVGSASAQDRPALTAVTLAEAMPRLPSHERYRVELAASDQSEDQQRQLATMIGQAAAGQHYYGAIYSFRPAGAGTTEIKMRSGLHSRDAARLGALADCEGARSPGDTECVLLGEVLPEGWSEETLQLSHVAVQALQETAGQIPGNVVVARSRNGDGFEILSGEDVRNAALVACNERNRNAALPEDCEILIDDLAAGQ
jgi:hypothetical protein